MKRLIDLLYTTQIRDIAVIQLLLAKGIFTYADFEVASAEVKKKMGASYEKAMEAVDEESLKELFRSLSEVDPKRLQ